MSFFSFNEWIQDDRRFNFKEWHHYYKIQQLLGLMKFFICLDKCFFFEENKSISQANYLYFSTYN
ncbi:hypothetical protein pb186bvf_010048 [Paramecium bursaria]